MKATKLTWLFFKKNQVNSWIGQSMAQQWQPNEICTMLFDFLYIFFVKSTQWGQLACQKITCQQTCSYETISPLYLQGVAGQIFLRYKSGGKNMQAADWRHRAHVMQPWEKIPVESLAVVVVLFSAVTLAWACALCCRNCWISFKDKERPVPS